MIWFGAQETFLKLKTVVQLNILMNEMYKRTAFIWNTNLLKQEKEKKKKSGSDFFFSSYI